MEGGRFKRTPWVKFFKRGVTGQGSFAKLNYILYPEVNPFETTQFELNTSKARAKVEKYESVSFSFFFKHKG